VNDNQDLVELLYRESRLLDRMQLDEWLTLYTEDARYWVPIDESVDPELESSIIYDDPARLRMRVEQLMRQQRLAQTPQSTSVRMISNLVVRQVDERSARAEYVLLVVETRSGDWRQRGLGTLNQFPAHAGMEFVRTDAGWKIRRKTVLLIQRHQPVQGLSFLL